MFTIPAVRYHRPNGQREEGSVEVDDSSWDDERRNRVTTNLNKMIDLNVEITLEMMVQAINPAASMVEICLDDGLFDYKEDVVRNDAVQDTVLKFVEEFDADDYLQALKHHFIEE